MARSASNKLLHNAKSAKSDEFYTLYEDIVSELRHYSDQFLGKVVYCNCDDARSSNFYKYFYDNFHSLHLRKLIASCYRQQDHTLFSQRPEQGGFYVEYDGSAAAGGSKVLDLKPFRGDGDFRGQECLTLLQQADIIVTNPPFSLFREYVAQLVRYDKKFLIIGNINAITYKDIFRLIQQNKVWLGVNLGRGISGFTVPDHYGLYGTEARIDAHGRRVISPNNCLWLTNLPTPNRLQFIELTKSYRGNEASYPHYDNFDGINVNRTQDIPNDFAGAIGVPITFLHKYNPLQFEIIRFRKGLDDKDLSINGKCPYFRILIRNKLLRNSPPRCQCSIPGPPPN